MSPRPTPSIRLRTFARAALTVASMAVLNAACAMGTEPHDPGDRADAATDHAVVTPRDAGQHADAAAPYDAGQSPDDAATPADSAAPADDASAPTAARGYEVDDVTRFALPRQGGTSGAAYDLECGPGMVVVGIVGASGGSIDAIAPACAPVNADGSLGAMVALTPVGGTGGTAFDDYCPTGQMVVGIRGMSGDALDRIALDCASVDGWNADGSLGSLGPDHGSAPPLFSSAFEDRCPVGYAIKAFVGTAATRVESLQANCVRVVPPPTGSFAVNPLTLVQLTQFGRTATNPFGLSCTRGALIVGIAGRAGAGIDALTARCAPVQPDGSLGPSALLDMHGGTGGSTFDDSCGAGEVVVGIRGASGDSVDELTIECAPLIGWMTDGSLGTLGETHGSQPVLSNAVNDRCPIGYAIASLYGSADARVSTLTPTCDRVLR
jgi:hypothetical protein